MIKGLERDQRCYCLFYSFSQSIIDGFTLSPSRRDRVRAAVHAQKALSMIWDWLMPSVRDPALVDPAQHGAQPVLCIGRQEGIVKRPADLLLVSRREKPVDPFLAHRGRD